MTNDIKMSIDSEHPNATGEHERSDVNVRGIVWFTIVFGLALVAMHFALVGYIGMRQTPTMERQSEAVAVPETFHGPELQASPHADLRHFKAAQQEQLSEYRWIDAKGRIVAIPIDQAIRKLAAEGLNEAEGKIKHSADPSAGGDKGDKKDADGAGDTKTGGTKSEGDKP
jgi:hypothetical protein